MRRVMLFLAAVLVVCVSRAGDEENESPRNLPIPIPEDVVLDDATLGRLAAKYADEKRSFLQLLLVLEANQIDYSRDSLSDIRRKKTAVLRANGQTNSVVVSRFSQPDLEIDYVRFCWEVVPRLQPNIVRIGAQEQFKTLREALPTLQAGDRVELGAGTFELSFDRAWRPPADIAIVGKNRSSTTLTPVGDASQATLERWQFADLKIDLGGNNRPNRNALPGGSLCLARCLITGYSMPYGVFANGKRVLVEDCHFDGTANRFGGRVFGISNQWEGIYLRSTTIAEQRTMSHGIPCALVLDRCQFQSEQPVFLHGNPVLVRESSGLRQNAGLLSFKLATDDAAVVEFALGRRKEVDPRIHRLAEAVKLSRNPFYWTGLLRHRSQEIRVEAAAQVQRLLGQQIEPKLLAPPKEEPIVVAAQEAITAAIRSLKSDEYSTREEARKELLAIGEPAVDALRAIAKRGTLEQRRSAEVILLQIVGPPAQQPVPRDWDLEYGRISRWFEENRSRLVWNEASSCYE